MIDDEPYTEPDPASVSFVLRLVRALHGYGESAQRVEDVVEAMAERLALHGAQVFSTPTSIMASFGPLGRQRTHMLRVRPGEVNLGKLAEVARAAFFVSLCAVGLARVFGPLSVLVATVAGLIVLIPGLTFTTALSELVTRHLSSGTARLSGAVVSFLAIAFGVVIFRADYHDAPWIIAGGALGVIGGRIGAAQLGVEFGAFVGSFAVALASTLYERLRKRPAAVVLVPGLLLLVPGTVGFRSVTSLMERQALAGIETAFSMALTAIALVAGLLVAGVVAPEPRLREILTRHL